MKHNFEDNPLYRLFNVIVILGYAFIVLATIFAGYIGYSERSILSATVKCKDGTSWNALKPKNILYDSAALSGICTNRDADGKSYKDSESSKIDYDSYETKVTKGSLTWSSIIYPIIVFIIGFGLVDAVRLIVIYVFSGKLALEKSTLLRLYIATFANNTFEKTHGLLLKVVEKEEIAKAANLLSQVEHGLKQAQDELNDFLSRHGKESSYFESDEALELDIKTLEEFYKLDNNYKDMNFINLKLIKYFQTLEEVNQHLEKGENIEDAKERLQRLQKKVSEETSKLQVQLEISKAIGEEIINLKKKHGNDLNDKKVNMDDILERIYVKNPDWRQSKSKKD